MDSMIMAARMALLILVTGLFTALWSGDHADQMATVDRPTKILVAQGDVVPEGQVLGMDAALDEPKSQGSQSSAASSELRINAPLPDGIAEGTYLIADQFGRAEIRVVSYGPTADSKKPLRVNVSNHYLVEIGKARWHYIRIETPVVDRTTASRSTSVSVR